MQGFVHDDDKSGRVSKKFYALLMCLLILAILKCVGHDNPFDPDNKLKGNPFRLTAETGYGKIMLNWNWPTYPAEGGSSIPLDSFLVYRKGPLQEKRMLRSLLQTTLVDTFGIVGDSTYQYQVAAFRNGTQSDLSLPASAFAYPLPLVCFPIAETTSNFKYAINFLGKIKFIAEGGTRGFLRVFNANDEPFLFQSISSSTSDMTLAGPTQSDSAYVYVCSDLESLVQAFLWTGSQLSFQCETNMILMPRASVADPEGKFVYVADGNSLNIFKLKVGKCDTIRTRMKTGVNPRKLAILPTPRRLFCVNDGSNSVSVFDLEKEAKLEEIQVNARPLDLWIGPDTRLYVACATGGTVVIIDPIGAKVIGEIRIVNAETGDSLAPRSVTGFPDPQNRHPGVLAVVASAGFPAREQESAFLFYYSIDGWKLQRYVKIQSINSPGLASFLARMNTDEGRIYTILTDRILVCKFKQVGGGK